MYLVLKVVSVGEQRKLAHPCISVRLTGKAQRVGLVHGHDNNEIYIVAYGSRPRCWPASNQTLSKTFIPAARAG